MKLTWDICGICDEVKILTRDDIGRVVPTEFYCEISVMLSNGNHMSQAICTNCAGKLTDKKIGNLIDRIKETWFDEMVGWANDKQFQELSDIGFKSYDVDRGRAIEKYEDVKNKDWENHLKEVKKQQEIKNAIK